MEHSTILYESPDLSPLMKIAWNKLDPKYLATIHTESKKAIILDVRYFLIANLSNVLNLYFVACNEFVFDLLLLLYCSHYFYCRVPSIPLAELLGHDAVVNGIAWAPHSSNHICTCGDDRQALIWDIQEITAGGTGTTVSRGSTSSPNSNASDSEMGRAAGEKEKSSDDMSVGKQDSSVDVYPSGTSSGSHQHSHQSVLVDDPILAFSAAAEINQLQWDASHEDWVSICFNDSLQILKV